MNKKQHKEQLIELLRLAQCYITCQFISENNADGFESEAYKILKSCIKSYEERIKSLAFAANDLRGVKLKLEKENAGLKNYKSIVEAQRYGLEPKFKAGDIIRYGNYESPIKVLDVELFDSKKGFIYECEFAINEEGMDLLCEDDLELWEGEK